MIRISETELLSIPSTDNMAYINIFTDAFLIEINNEMTHANMNKLNGYQHALLAYRFFRDEVTNGGFVQLIQNGYGGYIFDNPTAKALKIFGAEKTSKIIYKAKEIFDANRIELERETTEEEFNSMYVDFEIFDALDEQYFTIEKEQTAIIAQFVGNNKDLFAQIF